MTYAKKIAFLSDFFTLALALVLALALALAVYMKPTLLREFHESNPPP